MSNTAAKVKQIQKLVEKPSDKFDQGDIITWGIIYNNDIKVYNYAAIKAGNGKWYITGYYAKQGVTLEQLVKTYFANSDRVVYDLRIASEFIDIEL